MATLGTRVKNLGIIASSCITLPSWSLSKNPVSFVCLWNVSETIYTNCDNGQSLFRGIYSAAWFYAQKATDVVNENREREVASLSHLAYAAGSGRDYMLGKIAPHTVFSILRPLVVCSLCFLVTYLTNLHLSPVLRILLCYLESLPFLQSPHHLFALDSMAVCRYWPNKNIAFIIPGGQFNGQVTGVDTNIPPLKPNSPAAFSSKTHTNPTPSSLPQS